MSIYDIEPGYEIPPVRQVTDAQQMKLMAALLHDPNPTHFDVEAVNKLGLGERPVTQGPMTVSYLADMLTTWAGGPQSLRSLRVRMLTNVFAGDTITCTGRVTDVDRVGGVIAVDVQAAVGDTPAVAGTAVVVVATNA